MPKIKLLNKSRPLLLAVCAFYSSLVLADDLDAQSYIAIDLQARQLTLDGVHARLNLLRQQADMDSQLAQDHETRQMIEAIYAAYGTSVSQAVAWAGRNREAIGDWLSDHPEQQAEYDRLARELDSLSLQLQALTNQ